MNRGIVITTSEHTKKWLKPFLKSLEGIKYEILVVANGYEPEVETGLVINPGNGYELAGIAWGKEYFDEFVHLMDTTFVKDASLFGKLFELKGHVFLTKGGYHYMGKFVSEDLPEIPKVDSKQQAIALELNWLQRPFTSFIPDLPVHTNVFEEKHGRKNMVLENDYIIKYKATWSL